MELNVSIFKNAIECKFGLKNLQEETVKKAYTILEEKSLLHNIGEFLCFIQKSGIEINEEDLEDIFLLASECFSEYDKSNPHSAQYHKMHISNLSYREMNILQIYYDGVMELKSSFLGRNIKPGDI